MLGFKLPINKNFKYWYPANNSIIIKYIITITVMLFGFAVIFFICFLLDKLPAIDQIVYLCSLNEGKALPDFIKNLYDSFIKVASLFIPILLAITTLIVNRYASSFIMIVIRDNRVIRLVGYYIGTVAYYNFAYCYQLYSNGTINNFILLLSEALLFIFGLFLTVIIGITVFIDFTLPKKHFTNRIFYLTNVFKNIVFNSDKNKMKVQAVLRWEIVNYIYWFGNIFNSAIKSKDYNNFNGMRNSFKLICNGTENKTTGVLYLEGKPQNTDRLNEDILYKRYQDIENSVATVYSNIFYTCLLEEYFTLCKDILDDVYTIKDNIPFSTTFNLFSKFFGMCLTHFNPEQSCEICENIINKVNKIYEENLYIPCLDFKIYIKFIEKCIVYNNPYILNCILVHYEELFSNVKNVEYNKIDKISNLEPYKENYKLLSDEFRDISIYCLRRKKFQCFTVLLKFLITKQLDLNIFNESFSNIKDPMKEDEKLEMEFNIALDDKMELYIDHNKNKNKYNKLKFYIIWYSYFLAQKNINSFRIEESMLTLDISPNLKNNVDYHFIKPLLLDFENHENDWNKLFVCNASDFFINTIAKIFKKDDISKLREDIPKCSNKTYLNKLYSELRKN